MFSKSCEYGLRAVIFIAEQSLQGNKMGVKSIAEAIDSPEAFTAKILQKLRKNEIVLSIKGPYGGFVMKEDNIKTLNLSQIVDAIDGNAIYTKCGLGRERCSNQKPCHLHHYFAGIRSDLSKMLKRKTIYNLIEEKSKNNEQ